MLYYVNTASTVCVLSCLHEQNIQLNHSSQL